MKKALITALAITLQISCALAAVPREWDADVAHPATHQDSAYQGETIELAAQLVRGRKPFAIPEGATAGLWWRTNGMDRYWGPAPAEVSTNGVVSASWAPTNDVGAASYRGFLGVSLSGDGSNLTYAANFTLRMLESPGFAPNSLPLPVQSIDFAAVAVSNAPWVEEESDPVWEAEKGGYATTGDVARAISAIDVEESDPVWASEKGGYATTDGVVKVAAECGFTAWEPMDLPEGWRLVSTDWGGQQWNCYIAAPGSYAELGYYGGTSGAPSSYDCTNTTFYVYVGGAFGADDEIVFHATRKKLGPARTSFLRNDGEDGTSPYVTQKQAEEGWWTEWDIDVTFSGSHPAYGDWRIRRVEGNWRLEVRLGFPGEWVVENTSDAGESATRLEWDDFVDQAIVRVTATRHRVAGPMEDYVLKSKKEFHADSFTNVVWQNVYSNGWVFLRAYTNELSEAY